MKNWKQTTKQIQALLDIAKATGTPLVIVSGEGEQGGRETYTGTMTARAVQRRLSNERRGWRWARVDTTDGHALYLDLE